MTRFSYPFIVLLTVFTGGVFFNASHQQIEERFGGFPIEIREQISIDIPPGPFGVGFNFDPVNSADESIPTYLYIDFQVDDVRAYLESNGLDQYEALPPRDSCNLVLYKFQTDVSYESAARRSEWYTSYLASLADCHAFVGPFPNFIGLRLDGEFVSQLPEPFELILIESEKGRRFPDRFLSDDVPFPSEWEHGFSKGLAVNKAAGQIVFWLIVW